MKFKRKLRWLILVLMPLFLFTGCGDLEPDMQDTRTVILNMDFHGKSSSRSSSSVSASELSQYNTHLILALPSREVLTSNYRNFHSSFAKGLMNTADKKVSLEIPLNTQMKIFAFLFKENYSMSELFSRVREVGYYGESQSFSIGTQTNNLSLSIALIQVPGTGTDTDGGTDTGGGTDNMAPTVTFSPANGATGVTISNNITITFSEAVRNIDNTVLTDSNSGDANGVGSLITLRLNNTYGTNIAFYATIDTNKKVITIAPISNLFYSQAVYVAIGATVEDSAGNPITAANATFTTVPDTTAPTVTFSPVTGATGVAISDNIIITFSEAVRNIDNTVLTDSNIDSLITLRLNNTYGTNIAFDATIDTNKKVITINPISNLFYSQAVYVAIGATVEDSAGNPITAANATFTTGGSGDYGGTDTTAPTVTFSPVTGATGVAISDNITITFSEAVRNIDNTVLTDSNIDSLITLRLNNTYGTNITFDATIDANKKVITIDPTNNLPNSQAVYVAIGATVEDSADHVITVANATFTTGGSGDYGGTDTTAPTAPSVSGTTPTNSTTPTWSWSPGGGGNGTYRYKLDNSDLTSGATQTTSTSYTPGSGISVGSHTLYVQERDATGNWSSSGSRAIVIDTTAPSVDNFTLSDTALKAGETATVTLVFSEAVASFSSSADITVANGTLAVMTSTDNITWAGTFTPTANTEDDNNTLSLATSYTDTAGNTGPAATTLNYVVDTTAPTVSSISTTADNQSSVSITDNITVTFSEAMEPSYVTTSTSDTF